MQAFELPSFSVIVPTHGRPAILEGCLRSLAALDYPADRFEVIVVDDGSPVAPEQRIDPFRGELRLTVVRQERGGPARARNAGAEQAAGRFVAFTDDDCRPAPSWLAALAARFAAEPAAALGGATVNALPGNLFATASQLVCDYLYSYYNARPEQARFFASNNLALGTDAFRGVGGFDPSFSAAAGEDRELCDRLVQSGIAMTYVPEAVVYHANALTLRAFLRQHFRYGRGALRFHRARAQRVPGRAGVEPLWFYGNLLRAPFADGPTVRAGALTGLLVLSQLANAAGFVWQGLQQDHARPTVGSHR